MSPDLAAHVERERAKVTHGLRRAVWRRDRGRCYLCGTYLGSDCSTLYKLWRWARRKHGSWHLDHVLPLSRWGITSLANSGLTDARCNLRKGAKTPAEYRRWLWWRRVRAVARAWPVWAVLAAWVVWPDATGRVAADLWRAFAPIIDAALEAL